MTYYSHCVNRYQFTIFFSAIEVEKKTLIIPLEENKRNLLDRIKDIHEKRKIDSKIHDKETDTKPDSELTVDELAARELLRGMFSHSELPWLIIVNTKCQSDAKYRRGYIAFLITDTNIIK